MIASRILFILSLFGLIGALNALWRPNHDRSWHLRPWWLFAVLTGELVPLRIAIHAALVAVLTAFGALEYRAGRIGLWLTLLTWAGYGLIVWRASRSKAVIAAALENVGVAPQPRHTTPWLRILAGYPWSLPRSIERLDDLEYAPGLHLDLYRAPGTTSAPVLLHIHGGSWRGGNRRQQARPLLHGLAARGWVTASASYPLVPEADAHEQVGALEQAVTWLRTEGPSHGVDPSFIAVTGGSAGGHLAALLALQPPGGRRSGVEQFVHAAVPLYGIFDLLNRHGTRDNWPIVAALMRSSPAENEAGYRLASPLDQVGPHAPPFFVLHGESDSLISRGEPENFVDALRATSANPVAYALLPGANHSFDLVYSLRTRHVVNGIHAFLEAMRFNGAEPARADQRAEGDNVPDVGGRPGG